jgi:predicted nucleic acid-binding protein
VIYADPSVIVKRYHEEAGSHRVRDHWSNIERIFTSRVAYAEVHAAFARKYREGQLPRTRLRAIADAFDLEWPAYDQIPLENPMLGGIRRLVHRHPLRGYDAIHLAAALWLKEQIGDPLEFWAADDRLESVARREGLTVVNPARSH